MGKSNSVLGFSDDLDDKKQRPAGDQNTKNGENADHRNINAQNFTFRELATATKNFRQECLLGEGGFGRVYRGTIPGSGQVKKEDKKEQHPPSSLLSFPFSQDVLLELSVV